MDTLRDGPITGGTLRRMQTEWSRGSNDDGRTDGGRDDAGPGSDQSDDAGPVAQGPGSQGSSIQDDVIVDDAVVGAVSDDLVVEDVTEEPADELGYDGAEVDAEIGAEFEADPDVDYETDVDVDVDVDYDPDVTNDRDEQDSSDEDGEQETHRSAVDAVDGLLDEVELALTRLDDGTYGRCEECGDPIDDDRLAESPIIRSCGRCSASEGTAPPKAAGSPSVTSPTT